ncbi:hypothetical protein PACTADRAFT_77774 [Pachysolen tannophilus NRRL Y-2460]|uniref:Thioredoxin domain-containing protein n=1 Tax=Pachysolen tannophilus NRRL Y-2460 TaxID=669874 RepID=A0A1E4TNV8_PACTA|nr:hypothetical protein PACTADRAFT_77774 [Pachysolen tannophilus NRRL Y-2460]
MKNKMRWFVLLLLLLVKLVFGKKLENGIILATDKTFESIIKNTSFSFIDFYSPNCRYCQQLYPDWELLAKLYNNTDLQIVQIDCLENKKIRAKYGINSFPTLKLLSLSKQEVPAFPIAMDMVENLYEVGNIDFVGERNIEKFVSFLDHHTGIIAKYPNLKVLQIDDPIEFNKIFKNSNCLVLFYAPWIDDFKNRYNNYYEKLAKKYHHQNVIFIMVDITRGKVSELATRFTIANYPTIVYHLQNNTHNFFYKLIDISEENIIKLLDGKDAGQYEFFPKNDNTHSFQNEQENDDDDDDESYDNEFEEYAKLREL